MFLLLKNVQSAFDKVFNKSNITTRQFDYLSKENTSKQMTKNLQHNYRFHVLNLHQKNQHFYRQQAIILTHNQYTYIWMHEIFKIRKNLFLLPPWITHSMLVYIKIKHSIYKEYREQWNCFCTYFLWHLLYQDENDCNEIVRNTGMV